MCCFSCCPKKWQNYWVNDGVKLISIIIYVIINILIFAERFMFYFPLDIEFPLWEGGNNLKGRQVQEVLGWGIPLARASGASLKLNSGVILIAVLRNFLSWLRGTFVGTYLPIDKNIVFHKGLAWIILGFATLHVTAHFYNFKKISITPNQEQTDAGLPGQNDYIVLAYTALPGWTGQIVTLVMVLMYSSAVEAVRRPMFEAFWFTHHLFIVYYALLCIHGAAALLESPTFWIWFILPGVLYMIERMVRNAKGNQKTIILKAIAHKGRVLELRMRKPEFNYKPGQYVFLACPYIANFEWHPFTISSSPDEEFLSCHIRIVGDWTGKLWALMNPDKEIGIVQEDLVLAPNGDAIMMIDGPFGAASEEVFGFETVVLFSAGIGVTPFASILKSIKWELENNASCRISRVHFYWSNRDAAAFEWFLWLLEDLEQECPFLEINLFFTGQLSPEQIRDIHFASEHGKDAITGLQAQTMFERPNIKRIIAGLAEQYRGQTIGVFFCGPPVISKMLAEACSKNTDVRSKTKLIYHKENF
eukprot:TRINITY_DN3494_c0_g1_i1.p1 TRINITY_DN3494_c0_g1~~TRINITY_DN3494_c0_g1_i1.p1  ORF type:complete len:532 (-),score=96.35 TRINITY_DN3494_c0_g1_i1:27-1622(-)